MDDLSDAQGPELEYYINRCQVLEKEIEQLKKANKIAIEKERKKSNATIKKLENELTIKETTIHNLRNDVEKYKEDKDMNYCIESLNTIIEENEQSIEEMKERLEDYDRIKEENEQLQQKNNQLQSELNSNKKSLTTISKKYAQLQKTLQAEKNKTNNSPLIDMLNSRISFLESELKKRDTLLKDHKVIVEEFIIDSFYTTNPK